MKHNITDNNTTLWIAKFLEGGGARVTFYHIHV